MFFFVTFGNFCGTTGLGGDNGCCCNLLDFVVVVLLLNNTELSFVVIVDDVIVLIVVAVVVVVVLLVAMVLVTVDGIVGFVDTDDVEAIDDVWDFIGILGLYFIVCFCVCHCCFLFI